MGNTRAYRALVRWRLTQVGDNAWDVSANTPTPTLVFGIPLADARQMLRDGMRIGDRFEATLTSKVVIEGNKFNLRMLEW